jgi:hypothetical protein
MCLPDSGQLKGTNGIEIIEWLVGESSPKTTTHLIKRAVGGLTCVMATFRQLPTVSGSPTILKLMPIRAFRDPHLAVEAEVALAERFGLLAGFRSRGRFSG